MLLLLRHNGRSAPPFHQPIKPLNILRHHITQNHQRLRKLPADLTNATQFYPEKTDKKNAPHTQSRRRVSLTRGWAATIDYFSNCFTPASWFQLLST